MSETEKNSYDLNQLEDMFEAIDSLTRATAVLASNDRQLAEELVKLTNTLIHLSESGQSVGFIPDRQGGEEAEDGIEDLTFSSQGKSGSNFMDGNDDDDVIIDVLTGEKIKK